MMEVDQISSKKEENTPQTMMYCAAEIAPPPPIIPSYVAQKKNTRLSETAMMEVDASNDQSKSHGQISSKKEENTPQTMMYCAAEIAPPPPIIPSYAAQKNTITRLSKTTKVAAPLTEEQKRSIPKNHGILCKCGCIPAIPSMFQMAELRKQAREKARRARENKKG